jgi:hypothetical protein
MPDLPHHVAPPDEAVLRAHAAAMLPLLGLFAEPAWEGPILQNLQVVAAAARLVLDFPLDDTVEPAPRFEP